MLFLIDVFKDQCCFFFKKTVYNESFEIGIFNILNLEACLTVILLLFFLIRNHFAANSIDFYIVMG